MPSCSARFAARPLRRTDGCPVGSRSISISVQPTPRTPSPSTLDTASFAAQRPAKFSGRLRTYRRSAVGQHAAREPVAEALDRVRDAVDLDDVDPELRRPLGDHARRHDGIGGRARARHRYSTVTDFARFRGWSTSVPRATAVW